MTKYEEQLHFYVTSPDFELHRFLFRKKVFKNVPSMHIIDLDFSFRYSEEGFHFLLKQVTLKDRKIKSPVDHWRGQNCSS